MKNEVMGLVSLARRLLDAGDRDAAAICCAAALKIDPTCLPAHNLRETQQLEGNMTAWMGVNAVISESDDIFRFFASHPTSVSPLRDYLADGWRTLSELQRLLEPHGVSLSRLPSFMEFACGHGRFTRHLEALLPKGSLHVSDVVPSTLGFLEQTFGVTPVPSFSDPAQLQFPKQYDVVFVLSLFSHLPRQTWDAWLQCLWNATTPNGLLVFTTHGEKSASKDGVQFAQDGFTFFTQSESGALPGEEYGCAYATEAFVRRAVTDALRGEAAVDFSPAQFWSNQDAYVLRRRP